MKKTIIALMALAGSAFGADYVTENIWSIDFGSEYTGGYQVSGDLTSIGTVWDVVGVEGGTQTDSNKRAHLQGGNFGDWSSDFEFSITLTLGETITADNNWPVFFELMGNNTALRVGPYVAEGNVVDIDGNLTKNSEQAASVTAGGTHTITLTKIGTSVSASVDGVVSSTGTVAEGTSGTIDNVFLGGGNYGYYKINSVIKNISWSSITTVPEPATATLSLLALAGLAARRRRK
ncbi:MAG: PEP-CTERM sorting domain-containing protein [Akkermansia sp.]|nr:PEP-CTERM sorting domain-containing protein [Akkermansia sp.]